MITAAFEKEAAFPPLVAELEDRGAIRGITLGDPNGAPNYDTDTLRNALASQEMEEWRLSPWIIKDASPRLKKVEKIRDALTQTTMQAAESGTELGHFTLLVDPEIPTHFDGSPLFSTNMVKTIVKKARGDIEPLLKPEERILASEPFYLKEKLLNNREPSQKLNIYPEKYNIDDPLYTRSFPQKPRIFPEYPY